MADPNWNVQRASEQFGPFTWAELVQLARDGHIAADDLLWRTGEAASRPANSVPGLITAPAGATAAAKPWLGPVVVAVVAVLVVALIAIGGRGDDASAPADTEPPEDTAAPDDTSEPETTATTTEPETTTTVEASTTAEPTTTAAPTTTAVPTTTLAIATADDLAAALPDVNNLPPAYASEGGAPSTEVLPASGPSQGLCGGANSSQRALDNSLVALARNPAIYAPDDGTLLFSLYAFDNETDAANFIEQTSLQAQLCPGGFVYQIGEGPGEDEVLIFDDGYGSGEVVWNVVETNTLGDIDSGVADERFTFEYVGDWSTDFEGVFYRFVDREWDVYERYGNIVLVNSLYGASEPAGFDPFDAPVYVPELDTLLLYAEDFRPGILDELRARNLIA